MYNSCPEVFIISQKIYSHLAYTQLNYMRQHLIVG